jgi:hypothetical protein
MKKPTNVMQVFEELRAGNITVDEADKMLLDIQNNVPWHVKVARFINYLLG